MAWRRLENRSSTARVDADDAAADAVLARLPLDAEPAGQLDLQGALGDGAGAGAGRDDGLAVQGPPDAVRGLSTLFRTIWCTCSCGSLLREVCWGNRADGQGVGVLPAAGGALAAVPADAGVAGVVLDVRQPDLAGGDERLLDLRGAPGPRLRGGGVAGLARPRGRRG